MSAPGREAAPAKAAPPPSARPPPPAATTWASTRERGVFFFMRLTWLGIRVLGRPVMLPIVHLVALYFFLFGRRARDASLDYLRRVQAQVPEAHLAPTWRHAYRHFRAFATAILDKIDTWSGRMRYDDVVFEQRAEMNRARAGPRGVVVFGSHLGNLEVLRAFAGRLDFKNLDFDIALRYADALCVSRALC